MKKYFTTLILLFIVIILRYFQELNRYQKISSKENTKFRHEILRRGIREDDSCAFVHEYYSFRVTNCSRHSLGDIIEVVGRVKVGSDEQYFPLIRLNNPSISKLVNNQFWGNFRLIFYLQFLESLSSRVKQKFLYFLTLDQATLASGMLLGGEVVLPAQISQQLKRVGMQHVVSASGYNVNVILNCFLLALSRLKNKKTLYFLSVFFLSSYLYISGFSASLIRAILMVLIRGAAEIFIKKQNSVLFALISSGFLMLLINPFYLFNIGFQLSFAATFSLVFFEGGSKIAEQISKILYFQHSPSLSDKKKQQQNSLINQLIAFFIESFCVVFVTQLFTFPFLLYHFEEVTLLSLLANTFLTPITSFITLAALFFAVGSVALPFFSWGTSLLVAFPTQLFLWGLEFMSALPVNPIRLPKSALIFFIIPYGLCTFLFFRKVAFQYKKPYFFSPLLLKKGTGDEER